MVFVLLLLFLLWLTGVIGGPRALPPKRPSTKFSPVQSGRPGRLFLVWA